MNNTLQETFSFIVSIVGLLAVAFICFFVFGKAKPEDPKYIPPAKVVVEQPAPKIKEWGFHSLLCSDRNCQHPRHGEKVGDSLIGR